MTMLFSLLLLLFQTSLLPQAPAGKPMPPNAELPKLPRPITSFGAAIIGDQAYVYGGNFSGAHHYFQEGQSGELRRLNLSKPQAWEIVATGPRLQGLALVAHDEKLYRAGGFSARNREGEEQDLWSIPDFAQFDPLQKKKKWKALPPLPEPRSSFDAVVVGDVVYIAGGWSMQGPKNTTWLETAWKMDLSSQELQWRPLAKPPFQRRAISLGAIDGNVYVIGGMQPNGEATTDTAIYRPDTDQWSQGPALPGEGMEGFGTACFRAGDRLFVSTISGKLLRLSKDRRTWELQSQLPVARFFHRMLPLDGQRLMLLGGASMSKGRFSQVDVIDVSP